MFCSAALQCLSSALGTLQGQSVWANKQTRHFNDMVAYYPMLAAVFVCLLPHFFFSPVQPAASCEVCFIPIASISSLELQCADAMNGVNFFTPVGVISAAVSINSGWSGLLPPHAEDVRMHCWGWEQGIPTQQLLPAVPVPCRASNVSASSGHALKCF